MKCWWPPSNPDCRARFRIHRYRHRHRRAARFGLTRNAPPPEHELDSAHRLVQPNPLRQHRQTLRTDHTEQINQKWYKHESRHLRSSEQFGIVRVFVFLFGFRFANTLREPTLPTPPHIVYVLTILHTSHHITHSARQCQRTEDRPLSYCPTDSPITDIAPTKVARYVRESAVSRSARDAQGGTGSRPCAKQNQLRPVFCSVLTSYMSARVVRVSPTQSGLACVIVT